MNSCKAQVFVDDALLASYLKNKVQDEGAVDYITEGSGAGFVSFGYVIRHILFNDVLRSIFIDQHSKAYKELKRSIDLFDPGIPGLDHDGFASFLILTSVMIRSGTKSGGIFIPHLRADSILLWTEETMVKGLKLLIIEPSGILDVIMGGAQRVYEQFSEATIGPVTLNFTKISTPVPLNAAELMVIASKYRDWIRDDAIVIVNSSCVQSVDYEELSSIFKESSEIKLIEPMEVGSIYSMIFPAIRRVEMISNLIFNVPERELCKGLVARYNSPAVIKAVTINQAKGNFEL